MSKEEKHLQTKIRIFEDMLLRCKNFGQAEAIQIELTRMRAKITKIIFQENGVLTRALSFCRFATEVVLTNCGSYPRIAVERR